MKFLRKALFLAVSAVMLLMLAGCNIPKVQKVNADEVKAYADPMIDKIFDAVNNNDLSLISDELDPEMKEALTEEKFAEIVKALGQCESKGFVGADGLDGYTRAFYKASCSSFKEDAIITVVFSKAGDKKVAGLFYR